MKTQTYYTFLAYLFFRLEDGRYRVDSVTEMGANTGTVRRDIIQKVQTICYGLQAPDYVILCAKPFSTAELASPCPDEPMSEQIAHRWIELMTAGSKPRGWDLAGQVDSSRGR